MDQPGESAVAFFVPQLPGHIFGVDTEQESSCFPGSDSYHADNCGASVSIGSAP